MDSKASWPGRGRRLMIMGSRQSGPDNKSGATIGFWERTVNDNKEDTNDSVHQLLEMQSYWGNRKGFSDCHTKYKQFFIPGVSATFLRQSWFSLQSVRSFDMMSTRATPSLFVFAPRSWAEIARQSTICTFGKTKMSGDLNPVSWCQNEFKFSWLPSRLWTCPETARSVATRKLTPSFLKQTEKTSRLLIWRPPKSRLFKCTSDQICRNLGKMSRTLDVCSTNLTRNWAFNLPLIAPQKAKSALGTSQPLQRLTRKCLTRWLVAMKNKELLILNT
jgi:hypothetical protein